MFIYVEKKKEVFNKKKSLTKRSLLNLSLPDNCFSDLNFGAVDFESQWTVDMTT